MENEPAVHVELWRACGVSHSILPTRPTRSELRSFTLQSGQRAAALSAYLYNGINAGVPRQSYLCRMCYSQSASIRSANADGALDEYKSCRNFRPRHGKFGERN